MWCVVVTGTGTGEGPYRFLGEAVVRAALAAGSHYMDISGEPQFMENMFLK
jgi:short subunit dehydrogenase-like uncharacterized protein